MAPVGGVQELDDFGLPIRKYVSPKEGEQDHGKTTSINATNGTAKDSSTPTKETEQSSKSSNNVPKSESVTRSEKEGADTKLKPPAKSDGTSAANSDDEDFQDAPSTPQPEPEPEPEPQSEPNTRPKPQIAQDADEAKTPLSTQSEFKKETIDVKDAVETKETASPPKEGEKEGSDSYENTDLPQPTSKRKNTLSKDVQAISGPSIKQVEASKHADEAKKASDVGHSRDVSLASTNHDVSEFSHQQLTGHHEEKKDNEDDEWQAMPAYAPYDIYDDDNKLIAKEHNPDEDDNYGYGSLGGAGRGYTRVLDDEDAESQTSMDDNTRYLFKDPNSTSMTEMDEDQRDAVSQLQATKDLLTEGQRIAYVGVTRLELYEMIKEAESMTTSSKRLKKDIQTAAEALKMWSQKIMIRLYAHMEISPAEQVMIEQLADHGVIPKDLTPALMQNSRVKNPMAEQSTPSSTPTFSLKSPRSSISTSPASPGGEKSAEPPPPYESHEGEEMPEVRMPSQLPSSDKIDIDLRWTVLCDLFLVLIADSIYDARSRVLLERVGNDMGVPWIDICRFEKRVTDALEMQQQAEKENWNEEEHLENRRKLAQKRRYVMMGLATVGGGLVIGLSAGLLAPLIGAGLAAGFTTIGVGGTSSFLAGAGGAAIITSGAAASGSFMGGKAAGRRTGAVKTFEYRPLHNNKRVNLIVTISGWMTSKNDDVRLPYSTIDPVMGDIYSILWEPEMLTSMGDTINILATEALTQGLQQVLGSTILISLMAALQLPVVLSKLAYLIDNPWAVSQDRAWAAGLILADSLIDRNLGTRPITLVGYSLGSRVIFSCLLELARKGAYGLVQNVYIFGSPIVVKREEFLRVRTVVAGRFINGYNRTDWILGYLFRLTNGGIRRVAGLATVDDIPGLENFDCTDFVVGHMEYRTAMPILLRECGWLVESDEFGEIEDPDPDRYRERQRELISEIEEARKELEKEESTKKGGWGIFGRKKKGSRQEWEVYEDNKKDGETPSKTEDKEGNNHGVLFDVDAIRAELAKEEELEVKELKSTLPPMKLDVSPPPPPISSSASPRDAFHKTKSTGDIYGYGGRSSSFEYRVSQERTPTKGLGFDMHPPLEDNEIQMTFDTSFTESHLDVPPPPPAKDFPPSPSPSAFARPEIKSAQTTPNIALKDPWADDDDEEFGKEKEMTMTFA
ncbi:DUF726-domain-containing protein [Annulohypoxylon truncatum]|uniref:DUF726-domain-containing protein n=1 Tax=Annulohypoxylon truncatum TaxID=327061 RepID=UPI0020074714|nr:DUF726-domain-containing protein [Annulohypoxylon truncatum]KAI1214196.1 DUF726-domain-containing protein [Annulohypoxylon truncatum]